MTHNNFSLAAVAAGLVLLAAAPAVLAADNLANYTLKIEFADLPSIGEKGDFALLPDGRLAWPKDAPDAPVVDRADGEVK